MVPMFTHGLDIMSYMSSGLERRSSCSKLIVVRFAWWTDGLLLVRQLSCQSGAPRSGIKSIHYRAETPSRRTWHGHLDDGLT